MDTFALLIEEQIPALRRYARMLTRDADDADDLVQDCLERALKAVWRFRGESDIRTWLFSILRNSFIDERRRKARRGPHLMIDDIEPPFVDGDQSSLAEVRDVLAAIAALPVEQREVLLLVGVEGLSYEEAARVLRAPIGTVMSRLSRGRKRLRQLLEAERPDHLRVVK
jgi:RNA polymerase sigma-70 factor (ECF subfamily)